MKTISLAVLFIFLGNELSAILFERSPPLHLFTIAALFLLLAWLAFHFKLKLVFGLLVPLSIITSVLFLIAFHKPSSTYFRVRNDLEDSSQRLEQKAVCPESFVFATQLTDWFGKLAKLNYRNEGETCLVWSVGPDGENDNAKKIFDPDNLEYSTEYLKSSISLIKILFAQDHFVKGDIVVECRAESSRLNCVFL